MKKRRPKVLEIVAVGDLDAARTRVRELEEELAAEKRTAGREELERLAAEERLHAAHGQEVRVAGHCGCPSPREWYHGFGCGLYHVAPPAGLRALAETLRAIYIPASTDQR